MLFSFCSHYRTAGVVLVIAKGPSRIGTYHLLLDLIKVYMVLYNRNYAGKNDSHLSEKLKKLR